MRKLVLTIGFAHFWVIGRVEPVVRHIVEDLETDYKSVIVWLFSVVENRFVYYFDFSFLPQLTVFFLHKLFALLRQLRWNLHKNVLSIPIQIEIVVFEKLKHRIGKSSCSRADFDYSQSVVFPFGLSGYSLQLVEHEVGNDIGVERLEELTRSYPSILRVDTLHLLSIVVVASALGEVDRLGETAYLVVLLGEVATWQSQFLICVPVQPVMDEFSQQ